MAYVITEPCIGVKDASCLDVCPVDCIYTTDADNMYFIHPDECIDCGACESVCPVSAIFPEDAVPDKWKNYTEIKRPTSTSNLVGDTSRSDGFTAVAFCFFEPERPRARKLGIAVDG